MASVGPGQAAAPLSGFYEGTDKISARFISVFCLVLPGNQTERGEIMGQTRRLPREDSGETCSPRAHAADAALIAVVSGHDGAVGGRGSCSRPYAVEHDNSTRGLWGLRS